MLFIRQTSLLRYRYNWYIMALIDKVIWKYHPMDDILTNLYNIII